MNTKWYISTLVIILTFVGLNQERTKAANQQIVLQFTDVEMTSATTHDNALETITKKLRALGISNIERVESDDTKLTIHYYSDIDALSVREFLSSDSTFSLLYGSADELPFDFPEDELPETCSFIVSDLKQQTDGGLGLNGKFAFELKQDHKRFSNPLIVLFDGSIALEEDCITRVAYRINRSIAIALDTISHTIPEVRAGPYV